MYNYLKSRETFDHHQLLCPLNKAKTRKTRTCTDPTAWYPFRDSQSTGRPRSRPDCRRIWGRRRPGTASQPPNRRRTGSLWQTWCAEVAADMFTTLIMTPSTLAKSIRPWNAVRMDGEGVGVCGGDSVSWHYSVEWCWPLLTHKTPTTYVGSSMGMEMQIAYVSKCGRSFRKLIRWLVDHWSCLPHYDVFYVSVVWVGWHDCTGMVSECLDTNNELLFTFSHSSSWSDKMPYLPDFRNWCLFKNCYAYVICILFST